MTLDMFMKEGQELQPKSPFDVVITGGGTGGHVYPGIAVAKELRYQFPSGSLLFIGTRTGLEAKIVPYEGFALETIDIQGFKSKGLVYKLQTLLKLPFAIKRAREYLKDFHPHVVFGTGGYVAVPVLYAAYLLHIPTVTLEPNRQPGLANKLLSKSVDRVAICFEETASAFPQGKVVFTGNPIRKEFSVVGKTPPPEKGKKSNLLIIGGSRGARSINLAVVKALEYLTEYRDTLVFTHQTGPDDYTYVKTSYEQQGFQADVLEFIQDIPRMYAKAHRVICRAGASTVAELQASHRPAILIPYPHGDRHQEFNAQALVDKGIAQMILQQDLSGRSLADGIIHYLHQADTISQRWSNNHVPGEEKTAAEKVVELCRQLAKNHAAPA